MAPMECPQKCERPSLLQGGGVYIKDGEVSFVSCNIYGNEASVSARRFAPRSIVRCGLSVLQPRRTARPTPAS